jgi:hypothetical protein
MSNLSPGTRLAAVRGLVTQGCKDKSLLYICTHICTCIFRAIPKEKNDKQHGSRP